MMAAQVADTEGEVKTQDAQKGAEQRSKEDISTQDVTADLTTIPKVRADEPSKSRRLNLRLAVKRGNLINVRLLMKSPVMDPNETDQDSRTALWWAAWSKGAGDNAKVTELLLANDRLDINVADNCDRTPLYAASFVGNVEVVELLLAEANLEVNARCNREPYEGSTSLHIAVGRRHKKVVRLLLARHDIDVNSVDSKGNTPLHMTIAENGIDISIARLLLAKEDVNPTMENRNGRSLLETAAYFGYAGFVDEMLSSENTLGKNPHRVRRALAMVAAGEGHVQVLKTLLKHTEDLSSADKFRRTPLHCASENGRLGVVELLLGLPGIDVHAKDSRGQTPLFLAARREVTAVEKLFLVQDDADKTEEPSHSRALLRYAVRTGEVGVVQLLLKGEEGQEIYDNTLDADGHTLMWLVVEKEDTKMMRTLREWDHTTLHSLVNKGEQASVEGLLKTGYNPDTKNVYGQTALHLAILQNRLEITEALIESNANVNCRDASKNTPMRLAVERKSYGIINLLLSKSAHVRGLLANDWLKAYDEKTYNIVLLREEPERRQSIEFIDTDIRTAELQRIAATAEVNRRLL
jgi:ankyrin repeat protein